MDLKLGWEIDMTINILGIDIAKNTFQLHGADKSGKTVSTLVAVPASLNAENRAEKLTFQYLLQRNF